MLGITLRLLAIRYKWGCRNSCSARTEVARYLPRALGDFRTVTAGATLPQALRI